MLQPGDRGGIAELRHHLEVTNYSVGGLRAALQTDRLTADIPVHLRRLPVDSPISTLIKLFLLQLEVPHDEASRELAPLSLDRLERMGLIECSDGSVRGTVRLFPYEDVIVAFDRLPGPGEPRMPSDWVTSVDPPTMLLEQLTTRRSVGSALDLGTGCGIQALRAARHAERVVATDINPRALTFTAFNAALNQVDNIECRQGSLFEPVRGETFDLVVGNPPYVISPESAYLYRDGGRPGDSLCRQIVEEAPSILADGGFAHFLISWAHSPSGHWADPLRQWIHGNGCDTWLLLTRTQDPLTHAAEWTGLSAPDAPERPDTLDHWLDYYRRCGIEAIAFGAVILRRRAGLKQWVRTDELSPARVQSASDHILRVFGAQDFLAAVPGNEGLLTQAPSAANGLRLGQAVVRSGGAWRTEEASIWLEQGLGFAGTIDERTLRLLPRLDGQRPLAEVLAEAAAAERVDRDAYDAAALPVIRRLLEMGFLELASAG